MSLRKGALFAAVTAAYAALLIGSASATSTAVSFNASISTISYAKFDGTLHVSAYANFRDYDCSPSYQCDHTVEAEFTLHRGYGTYGNTMSQAVANTKYNSFMSITFKVPPCRFIAKYRSQPYTVTMDAVAPNGDEKKTSRTFNVRSCR